MKLAEMEVSVNLEKIIKLGSLKFGERALLEVSTQGFTAIMRDPSIVHIMYSCVLERPTHLCPCMCMPMYVHICVHACACLLVCHLL